MTKAELIAKLEGAKELTSVVSIDLVIAALGMLEDAPATVGGTKITSRTADEIGRRIEECFDYNSRDFVDLDSAEFEFGYDGKSVELREVNVDIYGIMQHVNSILEEYIDEDLAEPEDLEEAAE